LERTLAYILLSDFVQSCMPTECFYVQRTHCMNAFMFQTSCMFESRVD